MVSHSSDRSSFSLLGQISFHLFSSKGDEGEHQSTAVPMEEEEDDDDDPENRYDSTRKDLKQIITHPRRGLKREQRSSKQVVKTRSACLVQTRSQASRQLEREARKQTPQSRNEKKIRFKR